MRSFWLGAHVSRRPGSRPTFLTVAQHLALRGLGAPACVRGLRPGEDRLLQMHTSDTGGMMTQPCQPGMEA